MSAGPASLCRGLCRLDDAAAFCLGCGRSLHGIARWSGLDDQGRRDEAEAAEKRLAALAAGRDPLAEAPLPRPTRRPGRRTPPPVSRG